MYNDDEYIAVKSGFSSGYRGEGPRALSTALRVLERHGANIDEYWASKEIIEKIDLACLTDNDIKSLENSPPVRPNRWHDYIDDYENKHYKGSEGLNLLFPKSMPFGLLDRRLTDFALKFHQDPDKAIVSGYRRLEDIVRNRTDLNEHGYKLFAKAFQGDKSLLTWQDIDSGEHAGRAQLFTGTYMAFRNRRAHREPDRFSKGVLQEFLLLNQLYILEEQSVENLTIHQ